MKILARLSIAAVVLCALGTVPVAACKFIPKIGAGIEEAQAAGGGSVMPSELEDDLPLKFHPAVGRVFWVDTLSSGG